MMKQWIHDKLDDFQSCRYDDLIKSVNQYEYLSFDIFDTLVKRDVPKPTDVFSLLESKFKINGFKEIRILAERKARECVPEGEVTLTDIYSYIEGIDSTLKEKLLEDEIKSELSVVTVNKDIVPFYEYCKLNKKIILISDMYLDRMTIETILRKCGIDVYQQLFISNELNMTKLDGNLYKHVLKELDIKKDNIAHVGNSFRADYLSAKKNGYAAIKIPTYRPRMSCKYNNLLCKDCKEKEFLNAFLNNHTPEYKEKYTKYNKFGYERFGPLLYGFINWLFKDMKDSGVEQVFFMARDGYIMSQVYHCLELHNEIPDFYFEVSRRSLRIPSYNRNMSYEDILHELTVPNKTNLEQIFDSLGLNIENYLDLIKDSGIDTKEHLKRDALKDNIAFKKIFNAAYDDVMVNAELEAIMLDKYLTKFDFEKKTAIVDIGWGGSMQKYLLQTLKRLGISSNIMGYYVGLTEKSKENLGCNSYTAKGYVFDCLNDKSSFDMERPFVGLFETMFLEQNGSVMRYQDLEGTIVAERYPYEYMSNGVYAKEAVCVKEIQDGALKFVEDYKLSGITNYVGYESKIMFSNLYQTGIKPSMHDVDMFGEFEFFNNGSKVYLAKPDCFIHYMFKPKKLIRDLFDSQWKVGFLKGLLKIKLPYLKLFNILRRGSN